MKYVFRVTGKLYFSSVLALVYFSLCCLSEIQSALYLYRDTLGMYSRTPSMDVSSKKLTRHQPWALYNPATLAVSHT